MIGSLPPNVIQSWYNTSRFVIAWKALINPITWSVQTQSHQFFFSLQEGEQGYLEGLASRYADLFRTHYGDVLEPLEELRRRETNASPRIPNTQLTTSHSQPIYVPGKYSVSNFFSFLSQLVNTHRKTYSKREQRMKEEEREKKK